MSADFGFKFKMPAIIDPKISMKYEETFWIDLAKCQVFLLCIFLCKQLLCMHLAKYPVAVVEKQHIKGECVVSIQIQQSYSTAAQIKGIVHFYHSISNFG